MPALSTGEAKGSGRVVVAGVRLAEVGKGVDWKREVEVGVGRAEGTEEGQRERSGVEKNSIASRKSGRMWWGRRLCGGDVSWVL